MIVETRRRQLPCYDRPAPPPALKAHLEGDTFRKAQTYSRDKTRFQLLQLVFNQILGWIMIKSGAYSKLWDVAGRFTNLLGLGPNWIVGTYHENHCCMLYFIANERVDRAVSGMDHNPHPLYRHSRPSLVILPDFCARGEAWFQQVN